MTITMYQDKKLILSLVITCKGVSFVFQVFAKEARIATTRVTTRRRVDAKLGP